LEDWYSGEYLPSTWAAARPVERRSFLGI
jgi:hypothetical protein